MYKYELSINTNKELPIYYHHDTVTFEYNHPNWHDNIEILYITHGNGAVLNNSVTYNASKGDVFVINSNNVHSVTSNTLMHSTCFIIDNDFCATNGILVENLDFSPQIKSRVTSELCENLICELDNSPEFRNAGVKTAVLNLILHLARNHVQTSPVSNPKSKISNSNIRLAMGYMKSHFNKNITLDEISFQSGLSKYYFTREFKKLTGLTPITYLNILRCNNAKELLKNAEYTIHEISEKCGFSNDSYFSKTFKKHIGVLPSEFLSK